MLIGTVAGRSGTFALGMILSKRLTIKGTVLRARGVEEKILVTRAFEDEVVPLLERNVVRPVIDSVFPFASALYAFHALAHGEYFGKIALDIGSAG